MSQLKEQNGRYYQECRVVMVATKEYHSDIEFDYTLQLVRHKGYANKNGQHLYILSDDEIKEGDWYYCKRLNKIFQAIKGITYNIEGNEHKIIATTDESLRTNYKENNHQPLSKYNYILPKPSDSFISKYIKEYNQGNQIKKMLVEYCQIKYEPIFASMEKAIDVQLKIDSGNVITLKKVEPELYTREQVEKLLPIK